MNTYYGLPSALNEIISNGAMQLANPIMLTHEEISVANWPGVAIYGSENVMTTYSVSPANASRQAELVTLIGKDKFGRLDDESRYFLAKIVGSLDFGVRIDIDKTLGYPFLNEQR